MEPSAFEMPTRIEWSVLVRLGLATLAGAAIGWNRYRAGKPAGIGTHALVLAVAPRLERGAAARASK